MHVAIIVVSDLFIHRGSKSLRETTMNLPLNNHRIDDCATVVYSHEAAYVYLPGSAVDIYYTDIATERVRQIWRIIVVHRFQARLKVWWTVRIGRECQFLNGLALTRRSFHKEAPRLPLKVL